MKRVLLALAATFTLSACLDSPSGVGEPETPPDPPIGTDPVAAAQASSTCKGRCLVRLGTIGHFSYASLNEHAEVIAGGYRWSKATGLVRNSAEGWRAINSWHRLIAGTFELRPVVWENNRIKSSVTLPDMKFGEARSINDWGRVVGNFRTNSDMHTRAYRWSPYSGGTVLPSLERHGSSAEDINHSDDAVGYSVPADGVRKAVLWPKAGGIRELGTLPGYVGSMAMAISNKGAVAMVSWKAEVQWGVPEMRAALWTPEAGLRNLGTLGGNFSEAYDVNHWGEVVGASTTRDLPATPGFDGQVHAFTWHPASGMVRLNAGGATQSRALAINSWGDVVGILNDNELVAWVWEENLHRWQ
jgi:probable HAF family extracellular repeat protein